MKADDFRSMSTVDIETKITDLNVELFKYKMQLATSQLEKFHKLTELKRDIARAKTILGEIKRTL
ncbi:MAG TPA: 50S ribosomal protein L29 [Crenotrichaceae bacterium]|nr:50S ribosomal protein L29 [Crenotrichaceae bacterium]